ncbi:spermatogenesis-associated serine-rich protein 1 [Hyla sarda]|uniref:spermatogenesis-associated serine-rich protein 1 n=1 Tax=Hyla sarda TaxID=327740 RepID=UPI0024C3E8A1|nr:spermatogenesis-associated serine-rich protein 1 [Hyla sarda]
MEPSPPEAAIPGTENCNNVLHHGCHFKENECHSNIEEEQEKISFFPIIHHNVQTYPNCDLDWKPCVRWLPSPRYSEAPLPHIKDAQFPEYIRIQRSYPGSSLNDGAEWSFYPNFGCDFTYHTGKRCIIGGVHRGSRVGTHVHTLPKSTGIKKKVFDPRNGIPEAHPGDKPYHTVEYSAGFHRLGSTLPVVNFRESFKVKADTFIPLQKLPKKPGIPYKAKIHMQNLEEEKRDVEELNRWKPAQRSFLFEFPVNGQK